MRFVIRLCCLALALATIRLNAQLETIPDVEVREPPTTARLGSVLRAARRDGWAPQVAMLRSAALRSYSRGNVYTADAWYHLYAWAKLLGESDAEFLMRWINAVNVAHVGHPNMPRNFDAHGLPLSARMSPELQAWVIGNPQFSQAFFSVIAPVDYLPSVLEILDAVYKKSPTRFKAYVNLALAIAVVYDVPPPPYWPHAQVTNAALPRQLPAPVDAFNWWVRQDEAGRCLRSLRRLPTEELKFLVDAAAPFGELEWAQQNAGSAREDLTRAYARVRYRTDRLVKNEPVWPGRTYRLADILATGGICADQAYFASEMGKALGIPTLLFTGAGNDARHAWFGYLDANLHWQLDAGRFAEERFVTGVARDPQTWGEISDHELRFLSERFHGSDAYRESLIHEEFAADYLAAGDSRSAGIAARKAVNFEGRNQPAWETLIAATEKQADGPEAAEAVMREAALVFRNYPDLEMLYVGRVVDSLRARGQTSEADAEVEHIAHKYRIDRGDLSAQQAHEMIQRAIQTMPLTEQIRTYNGLVDTLGPGAGVPFYDQVVRLFVEHLGQLQHREEALRALDRARMVLNVAPGTQLDHEFKQLEQATNRP